MKQRLVGTLVLGSLALIVIPLLLDGEGVERPPLSATTPPAPIIDTTPLPEPTRPEILADSFEPFPAADAELADAVELDDAGNASDTASSAADGSSAGEPDAVNVPTETATVARSNAADPVPAANVEEATAEAVASSRSISAPALDASGLPETWAVRVGVFGNANNARRLEERLKTDSYKAFVRPLGVSTAVYIGPLATRDEAVAIQQRLNDAKSSYQIDGVSVQRYDIGQQ